MNKLLITTILTASIITAANAGEHAHKHDDHHGRIGFEKAKQIAVEAVKNSIKVEEAELELIPKEEDKKEPKAEEKEEKAPAKKPEPKPKKAAVPKAKKTKKEGGDKKKGKGDDFLTSGQTIQLDL